MSIFLEISQLDNGDVVLREAKDGEVKTSDRDPIIQIRFSEEVKDMLGGEVVEVAEAMIDAATDFLDALDVDAGGAVLGLDGDAEGEIDRTSQQTPTIH
jgi:hypothetical protein